MGRWIISVQKREIIRSDLKNKWFWGMCGGFAAHTPNYHFAD
jgi:hypothetical protein